MSSQRIEEFLEVLFHIFPIQNEVLSGEQEIEYIIV